MPLAVPSALPRPVLHRRPETSAGRFVFGHPPVAATLFTVFALLAVAASVDGSRLLLHVDRPISVWVVAHRSPAATAFFEHVTFLGSSWATYGGGAVLALLALARCRHAAALVTLATAVRPLAEYAIKLAVDRHRPDVVAAMVQHGPSFPSGHVLGASTLFFLAVMVAALYIRSPRVWRCCVAAGATLVLLVAMSRVYLAFHWPTDVLGGLIGGALLVSSLDLAYRRWHAPRPCWGPRPASTR